MFRTLLVEDDPVSRKILEKVLKDQGFDVTSCPDAETGWEALQVQSYPLLLLDWMLPGMTGLDLCRKIRASEMGEFSVIILITSKDQPGDLQKVLDAGADDYLPKPISKNLLVIRLSIAANQVKNLLRRKEAEDEINTLRRQLADNAQFGDFVGKSKPMRQVYSLIHDLAGVDSTVLITGPTGTGKELVARAIHNNSFRKAKPFIAVNCGGLSESLIASQLFGHRRGAFTGAVQDHKGVFESAQGGTLFLDEIGELPLNLQTSLLRVLESREITRLGESIPRKVDVRVLTATHQDLTQMIENHTFRSDLLYRVRVARIDLPPLKGRREDIPLLVEHFLKEATNAMGKNIKEIQTDAIRALMTYDWPGNIRELRNAIEFAVVRSKSGKVKAEDLPPEICPKPLPLSFDYAAGKGEGEKTRILQALEMARGNRSEAARLMGVSRATFYRRLKDFDF